MPTFQLSLHEREHVVDDRNKLSVGSQNLTSLIESDFGSVDQTMRFGESSNLVLAEAVSFECHDVDTASSRGGTIRQHEGRNIVQHAAHPTDECEGSHGGEVVNRCGPRECDMVVDVDMAAHQHGVGRDDVIADSAIVGDVRAGHEESVAADDRDTFFLFTGAIDGHRFAKDVLVSNVDSRVTSLVTQILRGRADHDSRIEVIVFADRRMTDDGDIVIEASSAADLDVRPHDTERADVNVLGDLRARIDCGSWINMSRHGVSSVKATTWR